MENIFQLGIIKKWRIFLQQTKAVEKIKCYHGKNILISENDKHSSTIKMYQQEWSSQLHKYENEVKTMINFKGDSHMKKKKHYTNSCMLVATCTPVIAEVVYSTVSFTYSSNES